MPDIGLAHEYATPIQFIWSRRSGWSLQAFSSELAEDLLDAPRAGLGGLRLLDLAHELLAFGEGEGLEALRGPGGAQSRRQILGDGRGTRRGFELQRHLYCVTALQPRCLAMGLAQRDEV